MVTEALIPSMDRAQSEGARRRSGDGHWKAMVDGSEWIVEAAIRAHQSPAVGRKRDWPGCLGIFGQAEHLSKPRRGSIVSELLLSALFMWAACAFNDRMRESRSERKKNTERD